MAFGRELKTLEYNLPGLLPWQVYFFAFALGIFSVRFPLPSVAGLAIIWFVDSRLRGRALLVNALIVFSFAGYGYALLNLPDPAPVTPAWMQQRLKVQVDAVVDEVLPRPNTTIRLLLRDVHCTLPDGSQQVLDGKLLWTWKYPSFRPDPGQAVQAMLRVRPVKGFRNPGVWNSAWYWRLRDTYWQTWTMGERVQAQWGDQPRAVGGSLRKAVRDAVVHATPKTQGGAMVLALLTGDRFWLSPDTIDLMRRAGLAHTLALSGLHVGFVALFGMFLAYAAGFCFPRIYLLIPRPKLMVLCAAPFVFGYAWLGQPSASLTRAALMFGFWGALLLTGRGRILLDGLIAALAVIVLWNPLAVFDLSLQFSACAVAGIAFLFSLVRRLSPGGNTPGKRVCRWGVELLGISFCANIVLMPLMAWYFGTLTPNLLMNLAWLPLLGFVVIPFGVAGLGLSFMPVFSSAGGFLLASTGRGMDFMLETLRAVCAQGWAPQITVLRPLWPEILGFSILLVAVLVALARERRVVWSLAVLGLGLLMLPHWLVMAVDMRDEVRVSVLDVGQAQAVLVTAPGGRRYLVDGGGTNSPTFDIGKAVVGAALTYGRPPRLEAVFMSHPDMDHARGLVHVLGNFEWKAFYTNGHMPTGRIGNMMRQALLKKKQSPEPLVRGDVIGDGAFAIEVLHPGDSTSKDVNENSLVLRVLKGEQPVALIPGDIGPHGIVTLLGHGDELSAQLLVLPHHGSGASLSDSLYDQVGARAAVASCGFLNRYGFPADAIRFSLERRRIPLLTTSERGMVSVRWKRGSQSLEIFDNIESKRVVSMFDELLF